MNSGLAFIFGILVTIVAEVILIIYLAIKKGWTK